MRKSLVRKNVVRVMALGLISIMLFAGSAVAGRGNGMGSNGFGAPPEAAENGDGIGGRGAGNPPESSGMGQIILTEGTPFEYSGTVTTAEAGVRTPMVITTDAGEEISVRIGPPQYWESLGIARPVVGDYVTVTGYALTINDVLIYFASTVTVGDNTVNLLDDEGRPLWSQPEGRGNGKADSSDEDSNS